VPSPESCPSACRPGAIAWGGETGDPENGVTDEVVRSCTRTLSCRLVRCNRPQSLNRPRARSGLPEEIDSFTPRAHTMANVFISYRGSDAPAAERLAEEIREAGHQVWLDEWEIGIGDSIIGRMNEGLEGAAYLVLCYSSSGVMAPWISREWMSALARQLEGQGIKILPVLLTGGTPPAILADIRYADLVADRERGMSQLLRAIR
jgi:hypothetical protein